MRKLIFLVFFSFSFVLLYSQEYTSNSRKAIKKYEKALIILKSQNYEGALQNIEAALDSDPNFVEAFLIKAEIYHALKKEELEIEAYKKVIAINPAIFTKTYLFLAELQLKKGKYSDASQNIDLYLATDNIKESLKVVAHRIKKNALFAEYQVQHPVDFNPVNLGKAVNTPYNDYWPSLSVDEKSLFTTVRVPDKFALAHFREDLYLSYNESHDFLDTLSGNWHKAKVLPAPLTTQGNEGACSVSADGKILFFTRCTCSDGLEKCCDIYYSIKKGNKWSKAQKIPGEVNSNAWEAQPSISADGRELYFTSNRAGGKGKQDIWKSILDIETGKWGRAINLGDSINTSGNEMSPFIHPDNQTLYFSSDKWQGMGAYDLFMSKKTSQNTWSTPQNLGYPINTFRDESGLIVNSRGDLAYFSSDREEADNLDIYSFILPENIRPTPVKYIKGKVIDAKTKKPLQAQFAFIDEKKQEELVSSYSNYQTGEFFISLPINKNYLLNVNKKNYLFYSSNFLLQDDNNALEPIVLTVELFPIIADEIIVLKNIFFETASYKLLEQSSFELNKLFTLLDENKAIQKIEIRGHTDNEGTESYNNQLSTNRAKAVYDYLVERGIRPERLSYKGYGFSIPISDNTTAKGKALNRRTEFKVLKIK